MIPVRRTLEILRWAFGFQKIAYLFHWYENNEVEHIDGVALDHFYVIHWSISFCKSSCKAYQVPYTIQEKCTKLHRSALSEKILPKITILRFRFTKWKWKQNGGDINYVAYPQRLHSAHWRQLTIYYSENSFWRRCADQWEGVLGSIGHVKWTKWSLQTLWSCT